MKVQDMLENLLINLYLDEYEDNLQLLEDDEEVKSGPEETIAKRIKLYPRKKKNNRNRTKNLTPDKLLTRLPILLVQIRTGNNSHKLKNEPK